MARSRLRGHEPIDWRCSTVEELRAEACFDGALAVLVLQALPDAVGVRVEARGDYDPHSVLYREPEGEALLRDWLADAVPRP